MRLATFNLLHGRSPHDGVVDAGRLHAAATELDADVLALQEVDRGQDRSGHVDQTVLVADALGAEHVRFAPAVIGTPGGRWRAARPADDTTDPAYGVGLVSRHPVVRWRRIALGGSPALLPALVDGRRLAVVRDEPRVALAAVLAPPAPVATVVAVHLSFAPGVNVVQLLRLARALRDAPRPVVLLGDLNLPGPVPTAVLAGWRSLGRAVTFPTTAPSLQLDHALVRDDPTRPLPAVERAFALPAAVSDHRALVVDLGR